MKLESKYRLKVGIVAIFLVLLVDVTTFLLAENSIISNDTNLIIAYTWNMIMLVAVLYLVNKNANGKQAPS